ncbi:MAG: carboxyl-terminal processing protease CtpZ [Cyanobacteriota bacterium]
MSPLPLSRCRPQPFATPAAPKPAASRPRHRLRNRCARALGTVVLAGMLLLPQPLALALNDAQQLVVDAWRLVRQSYVDPDQLEQLHWQQRRQRTLEQPIERSAQAYDAIDALLASLADPYTRLLRPEEFAALRQSNEGTVSGVGLQLGLRPADNQVVVIAPLADSPAAEARIASGTAVLAVDGQSTQSLRLERAAALLRGPAGSEVEIRLRDDKSGTIRDVRLTRRQVDLAPVRARRLREQGHELGYLRITQFSEPVPSLVEQALAEFQQVNGSGTPPIEGLILDLRNNSGGLVSAGLAVANGLLGHATVVQTLDRGGIPSMQESAAEQQFAGPLLTLVNGGTASASEILAGALQDNGRSRLAGSQTFGKGLIQTLIPLGDGSGLAVTVAHYLTPAGHNIQSLGIQPDVVLSPPEPLAPGERDDHWLRAAEMLLVEQLATGEAKP